MIDWQILHPRGHDLLGFIPEFLSEDDPRPAAEQFNESYAHGGGWQPFGAAEWKFDAETGALTYPGDPAYKPVAKATLREETIWVYPHAWVCIAGPNGHEVARMD